MTGKPAIDWAVGRKLQPYFVLVCLDVRKAAERDDEISDERLADLAGVKARSIDRFENGEHFPAQNLEAYAAAYASLVGMDARDIYQLAVQRWVDAGDKARPLTPRELRRLEPHDDNSIAEIMEAILHAEKTTERRSTSKRDESARRPTATHQRRAAAG